MTGFRKIFLVLALLLAAPVSALADDGYDLWLRYKPVEARWLTPYRAANTVLVTGAASPTLDAARDELVRGLTGLLARPQKSGAVADGFRREEGLKHSRLDLDIHPDARIGDRKS